MRKRRYHRTVPGWRTDDREVISGALMGRELLTHAESCRCAPAPDFVFLCRIWWRLSKAIVERIARETRFVLHAIGRVLQQEQRKQEKYFSGEAMKLTEAQRGDILHLHQFALGHGLKRSPERIAEHLGIPVDATRKVIADATPKRRGRPPLPRDADGNIVRPESGGERKRNPDQRPAPDPELKEQIPQRRTVSAAMVPTLLPRVPTRIAAKSTFTR